LLLGVVLTLAGGCSSAQPRGEPRPNLFPKATESELRSPVVAVRKIADERGAVLGYLKVKEDVAPKKRSVRLFWVHDTYFKVLGFYTESGETYRVTREQELEPLGTLHVDAAKRVLLRLKADMPIQLLDMDAPRTIESDVEKAQAAAAAAEAAKTTKPAAAAGEGAAGATN
jgi:hypothetical protein